MRRPALSFPASCSASHPAGAERSGNAGIDGRDEAVTEDRIRAGTWMTAPPLTVPAHALLSAAVACLARSAEEAVPVVDDSGALVGVVSKTRILAWIAEGGDMRTPVEAVMETDVTAVGPDAPLEAVLPTPGTVVPVVDDARRVVGVLTLGDALRAVLHELGRTSVRIDSVLSSVHTLSVVLDAAYEGIVVVDAQGIIREINSAYCRFLGVRREEAVGRHVTEVIDNTRMHIVVQTGIPERGCVQRVRGQEVVVHRIPIWDGGKVIGGVGMVVFRSVSELVDLLERIQETIRAESETRANASDESKVVSVPVGNREGRDPFATLLGRSEALETVKRLARKAARTPATVLITGESGTGKELLARAIHAASPFANGPIVSVNCAAIPESLLEAELFGYEEGAFTGARKGGKPGKIELANGGTLFLDEIGDMPLAMQAKLLRVLEERRVERVGGVTSRPVTMRVVAATNRSLEEMVRKGAFRADLYYRLNIIRLHLPPLRERRSDIPLLLSHHLERVVRRYRLPAKSFTKEAVSALMAYPWPGNVRELVNTVEALVNLVDGPVIRSEDLPPHIRSAAEMPGCRDAEEAKGDRSLVQDVKRAAEERERERIVEALSQAGGNKAKAARLLGIHRSTLYEKLRKYGLLPSAAPPAKRAT